MTAPIIDMTKTTTGQMKSKLLGARRGSIHSTFSIIDAVVLSFVFSFSSSRNRHVNTKKIVKTDPPKIAFKKLLSFMKITINR